MPKDWLRYDRLVQDAMRGVVREALRGVAANGFPGNHHFYVTFRTNAPGAEVPDRLLAAYPQEMTIVLQHQFYGLDVGDEAFAVTLSFNKSLERLRVPFDAITAFVDPAVNFGLQFQAVQDEPPATGPVAVPSPEREPEAASDQPEAPAEKVVSLDSFRKK